MRQISVNSERSYQVTFPEDWSKRLAAITKDRNYVVISPASIRPHLNDLDEERVILTDDGELQKTVSSYSVTIEKLAQRELDRGALVVAIGGGATTDLAGFVAATYLRGVDWVAVPTTVAGMVDAAIGGKTGINLEAGKNLAGVFHSPIEVIVDTNWLKSLSQRDIKAGLAEAIKCGFIGEPRILDLMRNWNSNLNSIIALSIEVKAGVVSRDFKESHEREILNYGHTLGHAVEKHSNYELRHGEAVSIGMCFAALLSKRINGLNDEIVDLHYELLEELELPTSYESRSFESLYEIMKKDKKRRSDEIRFVTLKEIGGTERSVVPKQTLQEVFEEAIAR